MRSKIHFITSLLAMVSILFLGGCEKEETKIPFITFSSETIKVSFEGGDFSMAYQIENPIEGAEITVDCDADWITDFNLGTEGQIQFSVAGNKIPESREAVVKVNYPTIEPVPTFIVKQMIGEPDSFTIEASNVTCTSMTLSIIPEDKDMQYLYFCSPTAVVSTNDDSLFAHDLAYFQDEADWYGFPVSVILSDYVSSGDIIEGDIEGLYPGTSYTVYIYGIDMDAVKRVTDIMRYEVETEAPEMVDAKFDFDIKADDLSAIDITFTPVNYDGYYCWGIFTGADESWPKEKLTDAFVSNWMDMCNQYREWYGSSNEDILEQMCSKGIDTFSDELVASTLYVAIAAAVNEEALICSEISYEFFTTGEVKSDNIITISVEDLKSRSATITITTTNDDPYTFAYASADEIEGLNDEDIIDDMISNSYFPYRGDYSEEVSGLTPKTKYIVYAVGYAYGSATTQLFQKTFTTPKAVLADMTVKIEYGDYADAMDIAALDSTGYAQYPYESFNFYNYTFIAFNLSSEPAGYPIYWGFFDKSTLDNPEVTDDMIINALMYNEYMLPNDPSELPYEIGLDTYANTIVACAVGEDENGNLSPLYKGKPVEITKDGVMAPAEWLLKYPFLYGNDYYYAAQAHITRASDKITSIKSENRLLKKVNIHRHAAKKHYKVSSEKRVIWKVPVNKEEIMSKSNSGGVVVNHVRNN